MEKKKLLLILGTAREGRESEKVSKYIYELLAADERFDTELIDVRETAPCQTVAAWMEGERAEAWREKVTQADALIIVTPEYNHGYPGELKLLLDQAYKEYEGKPVGLVGVSSGGFGGTRVIENLLPVLTELGLRIIRDKVYVSNVKDFNGEEYREQIEKMLNKVHLETTALAE